MPRRKRNQGINLEGLRVLGKPEEFGATCAFLCSEQASFISGQNIQLDGGSYEGLI